MKTINLLTRLKFSIHASKLYLGSVFIGMKLTLILMVCNSMQVLGQKAVILGSPRISNGFLILDKSDPSIEFFNIRIIDREWKNDGTTLERVVDNVEIWDENYFLLADRYRHPAWNHQILLDIQAIDGNHLVITDTPYVPCINGDPLESTSYVCNSCDYSYTIVNTYHPEGEYPGTHLSLEGGPGYMWWGNNQLPGIGTNGSYAVPGHFNEIYPLNFYQIAIVDEDLSNCNEHRTSDCGCVGSEQNQYAYGFTKTLNEWVEYYGEQVFQHEASDLDEAIAAMNFFSQDPIEPTLVCDHMIELEWGGETESDEWQEWQSVLDEILLNPAPEGGKEGFQIGDVGVSIDFWDVFTNVLAHYGSDAEKGQPAITRIEAIKISKVSLNGNSSPIEFNSSDFSQATSDASNLNFTLLPGLYNCVIRFPDGKIHNFFFEVTNKISNAISMSDLVSIVIFPVPIQTGDYSFHLTTLASVQFEYILSDLNGNNLFRNNYSVQNGHDQNHFVNVSASIPNGILANRFKFSDGSELLLTTMKTDK